MNRRPTREQNDIARIIGNLPKRLQQKIQQDIQSEASSSNPLTPRQQAEVNSHSNGRTRAESAINKAAINKTPAEAAADHTLKSLEAQPGIDIDYFLRGSLSDFSTSSSRVLETSARVATASNLSLADKKQQHINDFANNTRGIIRLKTNDNATIGAYGGGNNGLVNRQNAGLVQHHMSPIRKLPSAAPVPAWFSYLAEESHARGLGQLFDALTTMLQSDEVLKAWPTFCETREQLQQIFSQLLLLNLKFCCEHKVDNFFWKQLFYNVREYLRSKQSVQANQYILQLLQDGLNFYESLHQRLDEKYVSSASSSSKQEQKYAFIAKVAAQKLLICLGDLSRYQSKQQQVTDYSKAAGYYHCAQALIPSNGIPYNQLAIVSIYARKKFDAIYYHMRSLLSANPICSARESLMVLFDEIRKKYEEMELKSSPTHRQRSPKNGLKNGYSNYASNAKSMRKEVWIYPDGVRCLHRTELNVNKTIASEEAALNLLNTEDLLKQFINMYLYIIGKLYTGIGMETIQHHQQKLLINLSALCKCDKFPCKRSLILKIVCLNIFALDYNMGKDSKREFRYYAFQFANQVFGMLLRKSNQLLKEITKPKDLEENCLDINTLLQFIKIYTDWLALNVDIWEPSRSVDPSFVDCWLEWKNFMANLQTLSKNYITHFTASNKVDFEPIRLFEDDFLQGFTPLMQAAKPDAASSQKTVITHNSELDQLVVRMEHLKRFQKCFQENEQRLQPPKHESNFVVEDLNVAMKRALAELNDETDAAIEVVEQTANEGNAISEDEDDNSENIVYNGINHNNLGDMKHELQISHLSKLKKQLEAKSNVKRMYNAKLEEMLKLVDTNVYIEVRPKYLMPDTNCFIDCLEDFERLTREFKHYTLIIPLTVVKELDGLSKGVKLESYERAQQKHRIHHFDDVSSRAKKSLDFIKSTKNGVKCVTTKGSIINSSLFALVEEEYVSNDDKILATALALSKTMSKETSKEGKCFIQTELILITTDRNLRVKALSRNLTVSELSEFLQWANDSHQC